MRTSLQIMRRRTRFLSASSAAHATRSEHPPAHPRATGRISRTSSAAAACTSPDRNPRHGTQSSTPSWRKLRREKEDREYDEMTADVNKGGGVADDGRLKMSSLTRDLGFGAHVVTVMFACALGGWFAGAAIARGSRDDEHGHHDQSSLVVKATLAGIGALGAMFVEAALFMLRDGRT